MVMYKKIKIKVAFRDTIQGGVPRNENVAVKWAEIKCLTPEQEKEIRNNCLDPEETIEQISIGFMSDETGLYVKDINWKAHIKDMLSRLSIFNKVRGTKNLVHFGMLIRPERVRFERDGAILKVPDGTYESVAHVNGPQGRKSALKAADYVKDCTSEFVMYILQPASMLKLEHIEAAFTAGQEYGFGANRTMGFGRYKVTSFEDAGSIEVKLGDVI